MISKDCMSTRRVARGVRGRGRSSRRRRSSTHAERERERRCFFAHTHTEERFGDGGDGGDMHILYALDKKGGGSLFLKKKRGGGQKRASARRHLTCEYRYKTLPKPPLLCVCLTAPPIS